MKIADVMTRNVRVIQPDRTVREAARLMDELNVGALPVCDGRRLIGMVTDRDITVRSTAAGLAPDQSYVREVMTEDVAWCHETDDVDEVVEEMSRLQVRRIPVVDGSKRLVGIVALGDLATDSHEDAARALTRISTPSEPDRDAAPSAARADRTRGGGRARLTEDERRELDRRRDRDGERQPGPVRRLPPSAYRGPMPEDDADFRFRDEDHVRAAFGPFGHPGEERARNARMRGGFGGEGYNSYGEDYGRAAHGGGAGGGGYRPGQGMGSDLTGRRRRFGYAGEDASDRGDDNSERERTLLQPNDRSNYGVGPGNTRFGNDATASRGEVRRGEHHGRGPKGYQRSDERIREDINERLTDDALIDASEIEVAVQGREATLTGTVRTRTEKRRAEDIAESVPGVAHVQNNLRVGEHGAAPATGSGDAAASTGNPGIGGAGAPGTTAGGRTGTKGRARQEG
ncbi:MAG TPA: CBS domain-containing protein [Microvirga sp.]|jgi:CBS domain-containing protein|nr:CBS domain-containing protein [Microvirga sp.]